MACHCMSYEVSCHVIPCHVVYCHTTSCHVASSHMRDAMRYDVINLTSSYLVRFLYRTYDGMYVLRRAGEHGRIRGQLATVELPWTGQQVTPYHFQLYDELSIHIICTYSVSSFRSVRTYVSTWYHGYCPGIVVFARDTGWYTSSRSTVFRAQWCCGARIISVCTRHHFVLVFLPSGCFPCFVTTE